jgi:hypothetical protein
MIVHDVAQGTPDWHRLRLGIPTASEFSSLIAPSGALAGDAARTFANRLIAEIVTGKPTVRGTTAWMERGQDLEEEAVRMYEFTTDRQTHKVGFITDDARTMGCSPDRLVGDDGGLEIKCPADWTHVDYLLSGKVDPQYKPQLQACLLITGRAWWDWYSYHPLMDPVIIRVYPDPAYHARMRKAVDRFHDLLQSRLQILQDRGHIPDITPEPFEQEEFAYG